MPKILTNRLKSEFDTDGYSVSVKTDYKFKFNKEEITIPKEAIIVVPYTSRGDDNLIINCVKKISHAFVLKLVDDYNLTLGKYEIIQRPESPDLWGYATVVCENKDRTKSVFGDGEVHSKNLNGGMKGYAFTMLRKRTEDRAVLRYFELYQKGFYASSENVGENDTENEYSVDFDSIPKQKLKSDSNKEILEIKNLSKELGLNRNATENIAKELFNKESISIESLDEPQKAELIKKLQEIKELGTNENESNKNFSESLHKDELIELLKQYKIDQDWDLELFSEKMNNILQKEGDFNLTTLDISELNSLAKEWIK